MKLENKVALITGSGSGIGLGIAERFAQAGASVMVHGLEAQGTEIAGRLADQYRVKTHYSPANLLDVSQIKDLVRETEARLGPVDILVNNAGIQHVAPVDDFPHERWNAVLSVNLSAPFFLSQMVWPGMRARRCGRILNIASVHGLRASAFKAAYVAAKHGLIGLTKTLALEGAPLGITVNALCPGYVKTPLVERQIKDQANAHGITEDEVISHVMLSKQPIKDFIPISALSEMALFLASPLGATITGSSQVMDGGWCAQ